jgi:tight adherence protein C
MILLLLIGTVSAAALVAFFAARKIFAAVPGDDRQYMDPPPRFYRLTWPLVRLVAHYCDWALPANQVGRIQDALRRAGQDYTLTPVQFYSGKLVASLVTGAVAAYIVSSTGLTSLVGWLAGGVFGFFWPERWLADMTKERNLKILRALPFFVDILTMGIEAGMNLSSALQRSVEKVPPGPLVNEINRLLREVRAGKPRADALRDMAASLNSSAINSLVSAMVQAELMGSSIGPVLRAQAEQRRTERFQRAEKLALEAPVKMLFPLATCIFPCTFLVIAFPIAMQLMKGL